MTERVTRSGRKVKSVIRYEPDEANLVDDFSDGSFGDSDFDGTLDGISDGSHLENSDSADESYTEKDATSENEGDNTDDIDELDLETDDDSVITEHVPDEEIIDIPSASDSSSSEEDSSSSDSSDSDSSSDESSSDGEESSSDGEESSSDGSLPSIKQAWKKRRHQ